MLALGGNELVDSPVAGGANILPELGPDGTSTVAGGRGHVDKDGTLVGGGNDIVASGARIVMPLKGELVTRLNAEPPGSLNVVHVTGHGGGSQVLDGAS